MCMADIAISEHCTPIEVRGSILLALSVSFINDVYVQAMSAQAKPCMADAFFSESPSRELIGSGTD